jgi:L-alanine-DL-glutamate epimerase-like enolase superfamily enzyme
VLRHYLHWLQLAEPFGISRSTYSVGDTIIVNLDGGWGEATSSGYFNEDEDTAAAALDRIAEMDTGDLDFIEDVEKQIAVTVPSQACARAGVNIALHDRLAKKLGVPLHRMMGYAADREMLTSYTIGIAPIDTMLRKVEEARSFEILKVKLGRNVGDDITAMREIRKALEGKRLRVDANGGWSLEDARRAIRVLADLGVEYVEQPLARGALDELRELHRDSPLPIFADEDATTSADLPQLAGIVDGINIKLMKCGGISEARRMIAFARTAGLQIMLGGRIESSVSVTAAAHLAPLVDHLDLDSNLLVKNDPFEGVRTDPRGRMTLRDQPGLGVAPKPEFEHLFSA